MSKSNFVFSSFLRREGTKSMGARLSQCFDACEPRRSTSAPVPAPITGVDACPHGDDMADRLPVEIMDSLRVMFDASDTDRSGSIDAKELKAMIEKCEGCDASDEAIQKAMADTDINCDGKITFDEMCTVIANALEN